MVDLQIRGRNGHHPKKPGCIACEMGKQTALPARRKTKPMRRRADSVWLRSGNRTAKDGTRHQNDVKQRSEKPE